jgi:SAM-dependent methyltransferase
VSSPGAEDRLEAELLREIAGLETSRSRGRRTLVRLMLRGDWRARALALSAAGVMVRGDPGAWRRLSLRGRILARIPGLRGRLATTGERGRLLSRSIANGLSDRCLIVRTAAALALGECRDRGHADAIEALLDDPFRPPRAAGLVALAACGRPPREAALEGCEPTPSALGEGAPTLAWLARLAGRHIDLLREAGPPGAPAGADPDAWAEWLAGPLATPARGGRRAEVERYAHEGDLAYQLAKPFGTEDRAENLRQLDAFVAVAGALDVPRGARVLDLGGGSGWVSELLLRYGLRPVTLDVSASLLRLAAARFERASLRGQVVGADMTALPFASACFEAAVVVDALHHVEDLEAVLQEVRRVVVPGGPFVVAEPGEGHSEAEKSRAEVREQGVREGEIHPFALERLAARTGFDHVRVVPRLPLEARFDPAALRRAMRQPVDRWQVEQGGSPTAFDAMVLQATLDHPVVVLAAGERVADSRAPSRLRAEIRPALERHGARVEGVVDVRNSGNTLWLSSTPDGTGVVWLGLQLLDPDGRMRDREHARVRLDGSVPPGGRIRLAVAADLSAGDDTVLLKLDLVAEGVCWFEDRGSRPAVVRLGPGAGKP